ncbi:MAG: hypothetical protein F4148_06230 [Caldilineaceae bacterium SB0675_bin_29]|uniref:Glycosyl hydrolase family 32 N-terminal domain-containing protein n=1 Tax=Caldilineaceae bacterium SB0675_bin_29 TaxID=2605266 RepID=A0A6B1FXP1_9CHLR|nr:hypothetical protein [Caldilineaceae bacterium SB0675_bin_29]
MGSQNTDQNEAFSIGSETQLFVDDAIISSKRGVVRTLHPGKKLEQPVLLPDRPWEGGRVYIYGTVHYDAGTQQFRVWYLTRIGRGHQHRAPGLRERQGDMILYATSADGLNWEKPELGLHEFDGSRANNILLFDKHSPTVIVDEAADPSERYKMAAWDWSRDQFGYWVAHSADGLVWNEYDVNPILMNSTETLEAITVAHDSRAGEYFAFHRRWGDIGGFDRRLIAVCTSRNFLDWSEPELIIVSDEEDDAWTQDPEQRGEFYGMSGFVYGGQFLGFLPVFNVYRDMQGQEVGAEQSPWDGPIEAQLVHSRDGRSWERFADRSPIIPRGGRGSCPAARRLCPPDRPIAPGAEVCQYYTAINTMHGGPMPPKTATIARASWRLDGFVSLDAGHFGGIVETVPLKLPSGQLVVNADASQGSLAVELLSSSGETLPGYSQGECAPVCTDSVRHVVRWQDQDGLPVDQTLRLRFHLDTAQMYGFRVETAENE